MILKTDNHEERREWYGLTEDTEILLQMEAGYEAIIAGSDPNEDGVNYPVNFSIRDGEYKIYMTTKEARAIGTMMIEMAQRWEDR